MGQKRMRCGGMCQTGNWAIGAGWRAGAMFDKKLATDGDDWEIVRNGLPWCITIFSQNLSCGISAIPVLIKSVVVMCGSDGEDTFN